MNYKLSLAAVLAGSLAFPAFAQVESEAEAPAAPKVTLPTIDNSSAVNVIKSVEAHLEQGRVGAIWAAIAPEHRTRIQELIRTAATKIDPVAYEAVLGLVGSLHTVIADNAKFIANNDMMGGDPNKTPEEIEAEMRTAAQMLAAVGKSQLATHEKFSNIDIGAFFTTDGAALLENLVTVSKLEIGEVVEDDGNVTVSVTTEAGKTDDVKLHSVQGHWYFDISEAVDEMAAQIEDMPKMTKQDTMRVTGMIQQMVLPMLKKFEGIETQEDFDATVQEAIAPLMMMFGGGMGGPVGRPPAGPGGEFGR